MLTCPWCGWNEIERPMLDVSSEHGPIEGLAECEVCGAEEVDPEERDWSPDLREGWRQCSGPMKMWDAERHGPLKEGQHFAISYGERWGAFTAKGFLVYLPDDHPFVKNSLGYSEAKKQVAKQDAAWLKALRG